MKSKMIYLRHFITGFRKIKICCLFVPLYILFFTSAVWANYGDSCSLPPIAASDNYLKQNTAYGHLLGNMDMTSLPGACDTNDPRFMVCFKNPPSSIPACNQVILNIGDSKLLSEVSTNPELGSHPVLKDIRLMVARVEDNICLMMPTSRGLMPLMCKATNLPPVPPAENTCRPAGETCYDGHKKSHSLFNFSGVAVYCLKETLDKVFFRGTTCQPDDSAATLLLRPFPAFQETLKTAVRAAFILYTMIFGFKMVMHNQFGDLNNIATFLAKFLLVAYFAVGLGPVFFQNGKETTRNGMLEYVLPFLSTATPEFAQMIFNAGTPKGLCEFDPKKYDNGYEFFSLWDAIDCRVGYYLGLQLLYNVSTFATSSAPEIDQFFGDTASGVDLGNAGTNGIKALDIVGGLSFFSLLFGFFMAGNIMVVVVGVLFAVMFISLLLQFITTYLVCLITLYVMAYISPIFIPLVLFEKTKPYFDSWLKILFSVTLQPAIVAGFIALLLSMYDVTIYKNCEFQKHEYEVGEVKFNTYELKLPSVNQEECRSSAGYKLLKYYIGQGWEKSNLLFFVIYSVQDILLVGIDLLYVGIFTILFYYFSKSISQFASDVTNGPLMDAVTASPTKVVDMAIKGAKLGVSLAKAVVNPTQLAAMAAKGALSGGNRLDRQMGGEKLEKDEGKESLSLTEDSMQGVMDESQGGKDTSSGEGGIGGDEGGDGISGGGGDMGGGGNGK